MRLASFSDGNASSPTLFLLVYFKASRVLHLHEERISASQGTNIAICTQTE